MVAAPRTRASPAAVPRRRHPDTACLSISYLRTVTVWCDGRSREESPANTVYRPGTVAHPARGYGATESYVVPSRAWLRYATAWPLLGPER
jgi:hypothetical protein